MVGRLYWPHKNRCDTENYNKDEKDITMTTYIVIGSVLLLLVMILASKGLAPKSKQQDSALKQRAIFNVNEQLTYTRLKEILPHHTILVHVSYDALLTTKFSRTRSKYRSLVADFVIVDGAQQVLAIVALDDPLSLKRPQKSQFQDAILDMAGYKVIRYEEVPEYHQLREDFFGETYVLSSLDKETYVSKKYDYYSSAQTRKLRVMG